MHLVYPFLSFALLLKTNQTQPAAPITFFFFFLISRYSPVDFIGQVNRRLLFMSPCRLSLFLIGH